MKTNYLKVQRRIQQAAITYRVSHEPLLLAVSKKHGVEKIEQAIACGQKHFGESYAQEAVEKIRALADYDLVWHFIGPIQSNKTKLLAENFAWVQSVDRLKVLNRLNKQRPESMPPLNVLLQIKIGDEDTKSGANPAELELMLQTLPNLPRLKCRGLMCIPPPSDDFKVQAAYFAEAKARFDELKKEHPDFDTLSMGMSGDLEAAIKMGTTMVRVGTDIFGRRN